MPAPRTRKPTSRQRKSQSPTPTKAEPVALAPETPDTRWWVLVASSVVELGAGRYGVWEDRPSVSWETNDATGSLVAVIKGNEGEPELYVNMGDTLTFSIGQIGHFESTPQGTKQPQPSSEEHNGQ
jgi:hypothetical protein